MATQFAFGRAIHVQPMSTIQPGRRPWRLLALATQLLLAIDQLVHHRLQAFVDRISPLGCIGLAALQFFVEPGQAIQ